MAEKPKREQPQLDMQSSHTNLKGQNDVADFLSAPFLLRADLLATMKKPRRMAIRISGRPMKGIADDGGLAVVVVVVACRVTAACNVTCGVSVGS